MKRLLLLVAVVGLAMPATAFAKGPDKATITGPGLAKAITITGAEEFGSPIMTFAEATGFFPAVFGQDFSPMLPSRPKGDLGPKYRIEYNVPGPDGSNFSITQDLHPYAQPAAVTYMKEGQEIFEGRTTTGGWWSSSSLKDQLVALGLPKTAATAEAEEASSAGFFSTGRLGVLVLVLLLVGGATLTMRRRFRGDATA